MENTKYIQTKHGKLFESSCPDCGDIRLLDKRRVNSYCRKCKAKERRTLRHENKNLYSKWSCMNSRCYNEKTDAFSWYGGRGIKVCDEWRIFDNFCLWALSSGYSHGLEIDRIDMNGDYSPHNCQWINHQLNSQKRTNSRCGLDEANKAKILLKHLSVKDVSKELNIPYMVVWHISKGNTWRNA